MANRNEKIISSNRRREIPDRLLSQDNGVNGIDISNYISNLLLFVIAFALIQSCGYPLWSMERLSFDKCTEA